MCQLCYCPNKRLKLAGRSLFRESECLCAGGH